MEKFKKNQIVVYAIVLMLVVAGYLNYIENDKTVEISSQTQNNSIGDAQLVSNNEIQENNSNTEISQNEEISEENSKNSETEEKQLNNDTNNNEEQITNSQISDTDGYFANSKIEREKMYSQMLETYQNILENSSISEEQKSIANQEIKKINDTKNAIMICENLILTKSLEDSIIFVNGDSINIVVKSVELSQEQVAQVQNIITREMNTPIENIHIMKK